MGAYLRLLGSLAQNLVRRVGEDLADCAVVCRRGVVYKLRSFRLRYDDVGPPTADTQDCSLQPEKLAALVESVKNKPWFCELDRKTAQDLVRDGGPGCFLVRPSASTKSLTLTLWHRHRAYNILIRQREDGLLALGSRKNQEMTFSSVEEMVRFYEQEPLILYSGGELTGRSRLKAPPPGLVCDCTGSNVTETRRETSTSLGRPSEDLRRPSATSVLRTLSPGESEIAFKTSSTARDTKIKLVPFSATFKSLSAESITVPFYSSREKETEVVHSVSNSLETPSLFSGSVGVRKSTSNDIHESLDVSNLKTITSQTDVIPQVTLKKKLAVSTPNIDFSSISRELQSRFSSQNPKENETPPVIYPRAQFPFKNTNDSEDTTAEMDKHRPTEIINPLTLVHEKAPSTNLSVSSKSFSDSQCL